MKVFITGGTGFVGGEILRQLIEKGRKPRALVRMNTEKGLSAIPPEAELARANVLDGDLEKHLEGIDAVIHLVGIIRAFPSKGITFERLHTKATENVVRAMKAAGVKRLVHMSALGAEPDAETDYFKTKFDAETAVKESGLDYTVMKPSIIYGPRDEFVNMLAKQVKLMPVVPVLGDGEYRLQPVSVKNVAEGFVKALDAPGSIGKTYEVGGPEELSYNRILDKIANAMGKKEPPKIHLPLGLMKTMISLFEGLSFFPVTNDQLKMLLMNNTCDPAEFFKDLDITPTPFSEGIGAYL